MKNVSIGIAIILVLSLIFMSFAGCGSKEDKIVGQWYNSKDKCLDIRLDGTWKLEDSYGTGTYKLLEDGETYEFTDFYGDTQESKINSDSTGEYIDFGHYGDFYKTAKDKTENSNVSPEKANSYNVEKVYAYGEDTAWVSYKNDTNIEYALIDIKGNIIYSANNTVNKFYAMDGGISYYTAKNEDVDNYYIVDLKGKIIASSDKGEFDSVIAYGDGMALVYKYVGGMQEQQHLYGIIDKNGKWVFPLQDLKTKHVTKNYTEDVSYAGEGMFVMGIDGSGGYLFLNSKNNSKFSLTNNNSSNARYFNFASGITYVPVSSFGLGATLNEKNIDSSFLLKTDGSYEILEKIIPEYDALYDSISDGIIIREEADVLNLYDYSKKKNVQVKKYTKKNAILEFEGDYGLLETTGEDSKTYFNLITCDGVACFEPICGEKPVFSNKCILYKNNDKYYICNQKGEVIASDMQYKNNTHANDGIFEMSSENGQVYIDKNGNTVFNIVNAK